MIRVEDTRSLAFALPEVTEEDHHGIASYRVRGKIIATVPDDSHIRIMVDEDSIRAVVGEHRDFCSEFFWGKRLACVLVDLSCADKEVVRDLLTESWRRKAPKSLLEELDAQPDQRLNRDLSEAAEFARPSSGTPSRSSVVFSNE